MNINYVPFRPSMLDQDLIISVPEKETYYELLQILEDEGVLWLSGCVPTKREYRYKKNQALRIKNKKMTCDDAAFYEQNYFGYTFTVWEGGCLDGVSVDDLI